MSKYLVTDIDMTSVANAIRTKGGTSASLSFPTEFVSAIGAIPTGGASNLVTGTFTPAVSEEGNVKTITISYTGTGFPTNIIIYPTSGYVTGSTIRNSAKYKAIIAFWATKNNSGTPNYTDSSDSNYATASLLYKSDSAGTDPTKVGSNGTTGSRTYYTTDPTGSNTASIRFKSATQLAVTVANGTIHGFLSDCEYTYTILYSE